MAEMTDADREALAAELAYQRERSDGRVNLVLDVTAEDADWLHRNRPAKEEGKQARDGEHK